MWMDSDREIVCSFQDDRMSLICDSCGKVSKTPEAAQRHTNRYCIFHPSVIRSIEEITIPEIQDLMDNWSDKGGADSDQE